MKKRTDITPQQKHNYMMLSRYQTDLDYYFGYGNKNEKHLYFLDIQEHINEMLSLWKNLPYKPVWLRATELIKYKTLIKEIKAV
jgi:hypothetical protein